MNVLKTGSFLARLYVGTMAFVWAVVMILGGGFLVSFGMEPFKTRGFIMIGVGATIVLLTAARFAFEAKASTSGAATPGGRPAADAEPTFDADAAIARYLAQKTTETPETGNKPVAPAVAAPPPVQRPAFGRRGTV